MGWACQAVPEDRAALEKEIARLQDEVAGLKQEVAALREPPPPPRPPAELSPAPKNGDEAAKLREDIERARAAIENAWRRLVEMIVNFQKDMMRKGWLAHDPEKWGRFEDHTPSKNVGDHRGHPATDRDRDVARRHAGRGLHRDHRQRRELSSRRSARARGMLLVYLRHTSASLTIQENADPDVQSDLITRARSSGAGRRALDP